MSQESYSPSGDDYRSAKEHMSFDDVALSEERERVMNEMNLTPQERSEIDSVDLKIDESLQTMEGTIKGHSVRIHKVPFITGSSQMVFAGEVDGAHLSDVEAEDLYNKYLKYKDLDRANGIHTVAISQRATQLKKEAALKEIL